MTDAGVIYAVFEDGTSSRVVLDFFTPDPKDDPVRLAFPDIDDVEMRNSARNGCLAAYRVLESMGHVLANERFFPSCQYGDGHTATRAHGASAGLAFALKFATAVIALRGAGTTGGEAVGGSAAATGCVVSSTHDARVEGVEALEAKAAAALETLSPGARFIYPAVNEDDLSTSLRARAGTSGVQLCPVETVAEAVRLLVPSQGRPRRRRAIGWGLAAVALVVTAGLLWRSQSAPDLVDVAHRGADLVDTGRYVEAEALLRASESDPASQRLVDGLTRPLEVQVELRHMVVVDGGVAVQDDDTATTVMAAGDLYRLSLRVDDTCYVYVHRLDDAGRLSVLWPPAGTQQRWQPGVGYLLPADREVWYRRGEGGETIAITATRTPGYDLEVLYGRVPAGGTSGGGVVDDLAEALAARRAARQAGLAGVFVQEMSLQDGTE